MSYPSFCTHTLSCFNLDFVTPGLICIFVFSITVVVAIFTYGSFSLGVYPPHTGLRGVSNITTDVNNRGFSHAIKDACVMSIRPVL